MPPELLLGAVADDYTGATDLAGMLATEGVQVVQILGARSDDVVARVTAGAQAIVIALKTRAAPVAQACAAAAAAQAQLRQLGARQLYFKYCSTFDSTRAGNIGPVTEALLRALGARFTIAVPALPVNGRTQYLGHLFVGGVLLSDSPLRDHPANPMTDPDLVRHLQAQTNRPVRLIPFEVVRRGSAAIAAEARRLAAEGAAIALVDAVDDQDLEAIARATQDLPLLTGASGLASKMPALWRAGTAWPGAPRERLAPVTGPVLVLAGSCSARTIEQIACFRAAGLPAVALDARAAACGDHAAAARATAAALAACASAPAALIHTSMTPDQRGDVLAAAAGQGVSAADARTRIEGASAAVARAVVARGVTGLVIAGGETSGAVLEALDVPALAMGEQIDPGVPHCRALGGLDLALALKSGNFGGPDFFLRAVGKLRGIGGAG